MESRLARSVRCPGLPAGTSPRWPGGWDSDGNCQRVVGAQTSAWADLHQATRHVQKQQARSDNHQHASKAHMKSLA